MKGKRLFTYLDVDENASLQKLTIMEQIRVLLKMLWKDDSAELAANDAVTEQRLQLKANLQGLVNLALKPIRDGRKKSVRMSISNRFDPVFNDVFNPDGILRYYEISVLRPEIDYDIDYFIEVTLTLKE